MNKRFKVYTSSEFFLNKIAKDYNLNLVYLGEGVACGYVGNSKSLLPFCHGSHVDLDSSITDITKQYTKVAFTL